MLGLKAVEAAYSPFRNGRDLVTPGRFAFWGSSGKEPTAEVSEDVQRDKAGVHRTEDDERHNL